MKTNLPFKNNLYNDVKASNYMKSRDYSGKAAACVMGFIILLATLLDAILN